MADLRAAAQQALEALENLSDCYVGDHDSAGECASCHERSYRPHAPDCKKQNAITALRAALAQQEQEQEPVAWRSQNATPPGGFVIFQQYPQALADLGGVIESLYTHPPRREWQSLTDREAKDTAYEVDANGGSVVEFARAIEAKLKEKNNG